MINLLFVFYPGSCGYFCLKHILKNTINKDSYINLLQMKNILNNKGYFCSCYKNFNLNDIKNECITLIKCGKDSWHYVIIKKIVGNFIYLYDPLFIGLRKKKVAKFVKIWSRVCLFYTKV